MGLKLKKLTELPLKVEIAIPPENPEIEGYLDTKIKVHSPKQLDELQERIKAKTYADDFDLLRNGGLYTEIKGLENDEGECDTFEKAMTECTEGPFALYLTTRLIQKFFDHHKDATVKNSKRPRGR